MVPMFHWPSLFIKTWVFPSTFFAQTSLRRKTHSLLHTRSGLPSWQGNKGKEQDCGSVTGKWEQPVWDVMSDVCKEQV